MMKSEAAAETFKNRFSRLLEQKRMTVRSAAEIAGVAKSTVQDWKSGVTPTDFEALGKLAEGLGVSLSFLLTGREDPIAERQRQVSVFEVLKDDGEVFDGICQVTIRRLIPRGGRHD